MRTSIWHRTGSVLASALVVAGVAVTGPAASAAPVTINLCAVAGTVALPGAASVPIWGFGMFASFGFLPQFLQTPPSAGYGFGASIGESGRLLLPSAVASFLVGFWTARLIHVFGARLVTGTLLNAVALVSMALFHDATWQLYTATTIQGVGSGLVFSSLAGVVIASVPREQTGVASGMNANIRTIGGSIGSAVMAGIVTARIGPTGLPVEGGYTIGFAILGGAMVLAAVAAGMIPDLHDQPTTGPLEDAENAELGFVPAGRHG